jgi:hypothetical protein
MYLAAFVEVQVKRQATSVPSERDWEKLTVRRMMASP